MASRSSLRCKKDIRQFYYSKKRRAILRAGEEINHLEVFESHNWICNVCGEIIDRKLRFPNKMAATVDHIIPLSKGGKHIWENVAPAHALCNFTKGDQITISKLTLTFD